MASLWRSAWDVYLTLLWAGLVVATIVWATDWRHGRTSLRDRRGRLRTAPALALTFAALSVVSGVIALVAA